MYNVNKLINLALDLENVVDSKKFSEKYKARKNIELEMVPVGGARCCRCFCFPCVEKVSCRRRDKTEVQKVS